MNNRKYMHEAYKFPHKTSGRGRGGEGGRERRGGERNIR